MLGPLKALLGGRKVVLASASPRRRKLLQDIVSLCVANEYMYQRPELSISCKTAYHERVSCPAELPCESGSLSV